MVAFSFSVQCARCEKDVAARLDADNVVVVNPCDCDNQYWRGYNTAKAEDAAEMVKLRRQIRNIGGES